MSDTQAFRKRLTRARRRLLGVRLVRIALASAALGSVLAAALVATKSLPRTDFPLAAAALCAGAVLSVLLWRRPTLATAAHLGDRQAPHNDNLLASGLERLNAPASSAMDDVLFARALAQITATPPRSPALPAFVIAAVCAMGLAAAALMLTSAPPADAAGRTIERLSAMTHARRVALANKLDTALAAATTTHDAQLRRDLRALAKSVELRDEAAYRALLETMKQHGLSPREILPEALQIAGMDSLSAAKPNTPAREQASEASTASGTLRVYSPPAAPAAGAQSAPDTAGSFPFDQAWQRARRAALTPAARSNRTPRDQAILKRYFQK